MATPAPIVLLANHFQFAPGQVAENPCVGSRMLLWCRQGTGRVEVDGQARDLPPDRWLLLPWRHRVVYRADPLRPFLVGGVHLCPDHALGVAVAMRVPHLADDPLHREPARRDARWPGLDGMPGGDLTAHPRLRLIAEYAAERFAATTPDEGTARALAGLLVGELRDAVAAVAGASLPPALARVLERARGALAAPHDLASFARTAGVSAPTLVRLFRRHLHRAPMAWLRSERLEAARRLLASSNLPVQAVAAQVGIADPRRFARQFRRAYGGTPRSARQARLL